MKKIVTLLLALTLLTDRALAFGGEGHRTVAAIAAARLNEKAKTAVAEILGPETLIEASVWPDEIKPPFGRLAKTAEARAFNHEHGDNKKWHYVNFPIGAKSYSPSSKFAYPHDIVHMINGCIAVLEGGEFEGLSSKEALRYLVHLVGDIHQPLHTVAGFYDLSDPAHPKLDTSITQPNPDIGDSGGNALFYSKRDELHACFDTVLVNDVFPTSDPLKLAEEVMRGADTDSYKATGKRGGWAAKWAGDSMKKAAAAYADLEFGEATLDTHGELKAIAIKLLPSEAAYRTKYTAVIKEQLRCAGVRLAQILNSVDWEVSP